MEIGRDDWEQQRRETLRIYAEAAERDYQRRKWEIRFREQEITRQLKKSDRQLRQAKRGLRDK